MVGRIRAGAWVLSSLCLTILVVSCVQPTLLTGVRDEASRAGRSAIPFRPRPKTTSTRWMAARR